MQKTNRYLLDWIRVCCDFRALHLQLIRTSKHAYPGYRILNSAVKKKWHGKAGTTDTGSRVSLWERLENPEGSKTSGGIWTSAAALILSTSSIAMAVGCSPSDRNQLRRKYVATNHDIKYV